MKCTPFWQRRAKRRPPRLNALDRPLFIPALSGARREDRASLEKTIDDVRTVFARAESVNRMITSITAYHPYGLVVIHQGDICAEQIDDRDPTDLSWLLRDVSFVNPD